MKFLVCHPLGMPNPGERLGFNLVHKNCSPQNYKRWGGVWVGQKLGGWVQSWVGGSCPKYHPPPLVNEAWKCGRGLPSNSALSQFGKNMSVGSFSLSIQSVSNVDFEVQTMQVGANDDAVSVCVLKVSHTKKELLSKVVTLIQRVVAELEGSMTEISSVEPPPLQDRGDYSYVVA